MTSNLKISTVQTLLDWEDSTKNLARFEVLVDSIAETDVIVLPEMFTTGFSMAVTRLAEPVNGPTAQWMRAKATAKQVVVMGSVITEDGGFYYNRLYVAMPDGRILHYNKRHLFTLAGEEKFFKAGHGKIIVEHKGWKINPMVCYDLRFPVWSRNSRNHAGFEYDVLVYVANWPEKRVQAWKTLLPARAIENQSYVVGVNRIGNDGNDIYHSGDSAIYDFKGDKLTETEAGEDRIETIVLNRQELDVYRRAYPFLADADKFAIED